MSWRHSGGSCLEGTAAIPIDVPLKTWVFDRLGEQVDGAANDLAQAALQAHETKQADMGIGVEFDGKIDVACRVGFTARERSEKAIDGGCRRRVARRRALEGRL